ncbi:MAG TPA: divalent-cation tolerance protein CutA [Candidatus Paceibacterota bacterium]|nr:divalent-cation tolerance protein CutA [Candidatus Paceibacterota bacterium]
MKKTRGFHMVVVTAPDLKTARRLARVALEARLIACANLIPRIESHYWWKDRIESGSEVLLLMKTVDRRLPALERRIMAEHPYYTPEFLVCPITGGNARYLAWLEANVAASRSSESRRRT